MSAMPDYPARRIVVASVGAAAVAAAALFVAVLPAEFGYDPLGAGRALGLTGLSRDATAVLAHQEHGFATDERRWVLSPFESFEYKYRLEEGDAMLYAWDASAALLYELHGEPDGEAPGDAESFDRARSERAAGAYVAPFSGIHGWFWENRGEADVTLTLRTAGFYAFAREYVGGLPEERAVRPPPPLADEWNGAADGDVAAGAERATP